MARCEVHVSFVGIFHNDPEGEGGVVTDLGFHFDVAAKNLANELADVKA